MKEMKLRFMNNGITGQNGSSAQGEESSNDNNNHDNRKRRISENLEKSIAKAIALIKMFAALYLQHDPV